MRDGSCYEQAVFGRRRGKQGEGVEYAVALRGWVSYEPAEACFSGEGGRVYRVGFGAGQFISIDFSLGFVYI